MRKSDRDALLFLALFMLVVVILAVGFRVAQNSSKVCIDKTIIKIGGCTAQGCGVRYADGGTGAELFPIEGMVSKVCTDEGEGK
jgi:hypothetical protein